LNRAPAAWQRLWLVPRWLISNYNRVQAGDLAASVAYHALIAILPMFFLLITVAGFFLRNDQEVLARAYEIVNQVFPSGGIGPDAFAQAFDARQSNGWIGVISVIGFTWAGTGLVSSLARSMNRIYGVRGSGYFSEKRRGIVVILIFALFFVISSIVPIVTTFFVSQELPSILQRWVLASRSGQAIAYGISFASAMIMFAVIYRIVPNAGQRVSNIWPGTIVASALFLLVTQVFPIYIGLIGGVGRNGQIFGFVLLVVASLYAFAQVFLFGAFLNAEFLRVLRRRRHSRLHDHAESLESDSWENPISRS
ncbi:MAG TPA: YihY/virulence factor BrkB family protein, partial [Thermomicrobiales bacterium]|nr:YihY/virulence factor BrkB family protein [Thermomicrobiales bacterium]